MKLNIMLVDNNKIDLFVSQKIIEKSTIDSNIRTFKSGDLAIKFLKIFESNYNYKLMSLPDIILLDIDMLEIDNYQFLKEFGKLKKIKNKHIKICLLSSTTNIGNLKKVKGISSNVLCLTKPLKIDKLNGIFSSFKFYLNEYDFLEEDIYLDILRKTP